MHLVHCTVHVCGGDAVGVQQLRQELHVVPRAGEHDGRLPARDDLRHDMQQGPQLVFLPVRRHAQDCSKLMHRRKQAELEQFLPVRQCATCIITAA